MNLYYFKLHLCIRIPSIKTFYQKITYTNIFVITPESHIKTKDYAGY